MIFDRITIDSQICHGKPVIKDTRILISNLLNDLASGRTAEEIIEDYPSLDKEDIFSSISFAGYLTDFETFPYDTNIANRKVTS